MMEIVAAADSDERGLSLLRVVNILQRVVVFLHSFAVDKTRGQTPTSASKTQQMPGMSKEEVAKKVGVPAAEARSPALGRERKHFPELNQSLQGLLCLRPDLRQAGNGPTVRWHVQGLFT